MSISSVSCSWVQSSDPALSMAGCSTVLTVSLNAGPQLLAAFSLSLPFTLTPCFFWPSDHSWWHALPPPLRAGGEVLTAPSIPAHDRRGEEGRNVGAVLEIERLSLSPPTFLSFLSSPRPLHPQPLGRQEDTQTRKQNKSRRFLAFAFQKLSQTLRGRESLAVDKRSGRKPPGNGS